VRAKIVFNLHHRTAVSIRLARFRQATVGFSRRPGSPQVQMSFSGGLPGRPDPVGGRAPHGCGLNGYLESFSMRSDFHLAQSSEPSRLQFVAIKHIEGVERD